MEHPVYKQTTCVRELIFLPTHNMFPCNSNSFRIIIEIFNSNLKASSMYYYYFCDDIQFWIDIILLLETQNKHNFRVKPIHNFTTVPITAITILLLFISLLNILTERYIFIAYSTTLIAIILLMKCSFSCIVTWIITRNNLVLIDTSWNFCVPNLCFFRIVLLNVVLHFVLIFWDTFHVLQFFRNCHK